MFHIGGLFQKITVVLDPVQSGLWRAKDTLHRLLIGVSKPHFHCFLSFLSVLCRFCTCPCIFSPPRRHNVEKVKLPFTGQPRCVITPMKSFLLNVSSQLLRVQKSEARSMEVWHFRVPEYKAFALLTFPASSGCAAKSKKPSNVFLKTVWNKK